MAKQLKVKKYDFKQYEYAITAFVGIFEKRLQEIYSSMPVLVIDTGDDSYFMKEKFENTKNKEVYMPVPRCVLNIGESAFQTEQDSSQHVEIKYRMPDENIYKAKCRRKATNISIGLELVCSNYIKGLEYLEAIQSLLSNENVYTYQFLGNTMQASYKCSTFTLAKNEMDTTANKNCVVKGTLDLELQLYIVWYNSIKLIGDNNNADAGNLKTQFDILAKFQHCKTETPPDYETSIKPDVEEPEQ